MAEELKPKSENKNQNQNRFCGGHSGGAVYGMGVIGALVYFFQHAVDFQSGMIGILKALFWPAFLIYRALELLKF